MGSRILTLQRQARELGRLRAGWSEPYTGKDGKQRRRPVASPHWVVTSPQRAYVEAAAEEWGGTVEPWQPQGGGPQVWRAITETSSIDAILPPGDPLSQAYELWSAGGAVRRCDGETDQLSGQPCPCRAQFGDDFYLQPPDKVCRPHSRLNLILPVLPDLGVWRVETHGFWPANELAAAVDLIRSTVGPRALVPVRVRIEPRQRTAGGRTKKFPVIVLEIRGAMAGQILAGQVPRLSVDDLTGPVREVAAAAGTPALPAGQRLTPQQVIEQITATGDLDTLRRLWRQAQADGALTPEVQAAFDAKTGRRAAPTTPDGSGDDVVDAEPEPDRTATWMGILAEAAKRGWNTADVEHRYRQRMGHDPAEEESATGWRLTEFLDALRSGEVQ